MKNQRGYAVSELVAGLFLLAVIGGGLFMLVCAFKIMYRLAFG